MIDYYKKSVFPPTCLNPVGAEELFFCADQLAPYPTVGGGAELQGKFKDASIPAAVLEPTPLNVKLL